MGLACFSVWLGAMRRLQASPRRGKWALWLRRRGGVGGKWGGKWSGSFWRATLRVGAAFGGRLMGALREVGWCLAAAKQVHGGYVAGARLLSILAMAPRQPRISHPPSRHPPTHSPPSRALTSNWPPSRTLATLAAHWPPTGRPLAAHWPPARALGELPGGTGSGQVRG